MQRVGFHEYQGSQPSVEAVVKLYSKSQEGEFLIVDHSPEASVCINLSAHFQLDENLSLEQFEAIKVLNNRIHPVYIQQKQFKTA